MFLNLLEICLDRLLLSLNLKFRDHRVNFNFFLNFWVFFFLRTISLIYILFLINRIYLVLIRLCWWALVKSRFISSFIFRYFDLFLSLMFSPISRIASFDIINLNGFWLVNFRAIYYNFFRICLLFNIISESFKLFFLLSKLCFSCLNLFFGLLHPRGAWLTIFHAILFDRKSLISTLFTWDKRLFLVSRLISFSVSCIIYNFLLNLFVSLLLLLFSSLLLDLNAPSNLWLDVLVSTRTISNYSKLVSSLLDHIDRFLDYSSLFKSFDLTLSDTLTVSKLVELSLIFLSLEFFVFDSFCCVYILIIK